LQKGLKDLLFLEINKEFKGWDFSYIENTGRVQEQPLSWNYRTLIMQYIKKSKVMLDMGTGGGEFLSSLEELPNKVMATERYKPNIEVAKNILKPLGIKVYSIQNDKKLPFLNETFDLVINRHESYDCEELLRIMKPRGVFVTQQVGGMNGFELNEYLRAETSRYKFWNKRYAVDKLILKGFKVEVQEENFVKTRFYDVGAVVYWLKVIPWQVKDFSIEVYYDRLERIQEIINSIGYIELTCHRFLIVAKK